MVSLLQKQALRTGVSATAIKMPKETGGRPVVIDFQSVLKQNGRQNANFNSVGFVKLVQNLQRRTDRDRICVVARPSGIVRNDGFQKRMKAMHVGVLTCDSGETPACIWRGIDVDDFDNLAYTIRIRLIHLLMAKAFCGLKVDRSKEMTSKLLSIANGFVKAERAKSLGMLSEEQDIDGWMGKIVGVVNGAANGLRLPEGYPNSSAVVRNYTLLAKKIRNALTSGWNEYSASHNLSQPLDEEWTTVFCESFGTFVFHPCQESDYALPANAKALKDKWGKDEVQNTSILFHRRPEANILAWKNRRDTCSDSEKLEWIKGNEAKLVETLGTWKKEDVTSLQSKIRAFRSGSRAWQECFEGVAVVKCAYRFVWYELGWTYFHATSDCDFCVKVGGEGYRPCLDIFFLG